jgi:hypothetical protein
LNGVSAVQAPAMRGIYVVSHHRDPDKSRIVGSYRDAKKHKSTIFTLMGDLLGAREDLGDWDLHHVVEAQHFADIDFRGRLHTAYYDELPIVLILKDEHVTYDKLLHIKDADRLVSGELTPDLVERSESAAAMAADSESRPALRDRLGKLALLYQDAYSGEAVLQRIAKNVIDDALSFLR